MSGRTPDPRGTKPKRASVPAEQSGAQVVAGGTGPVALDDHEQRREPRYPAVGLVVVRFGEPEQEVRGWLVDISLSGFRIAHDCRTLETGQTVEFTHPEAHGKARVVWNRIALGRVESGLVLVGV
jgi:hypothetical protein